MSLRQIAIGSLSMSSVGVLRILTQILVLPVIARYLTPYDYGVIAIAMPFIIFAMMFSDAGISSSLIRSSSKNKVEWSSGFWLVCFLGLVLSFVVVLIGFIVSVFMDDEALFPIVSALSLVIFLQSVATVPGASLQQKNKFTIIAFIEIMAMVMSLISTLLSAMYGFGAWALVMQQLAHYVVKVILTFFYSRFYPLLTFKLDTIKHHLIFGRDLLSVSIIGFIKDAVNNVIVGKVLGTAILGSYSMAQTFSTVPHRIVSGPVQLVLYPRLAALREHPLVVKELFLQISRLLAIFLVPLIAMLAVAHAPIFHIVLSEKWAFAGHLFMLIAPAAIVQSVTALRATVAMAYGRTDIVFKQSVEFCVLFLIVLSTTIWFGIEYFVGGVVVLILAYTPRALIQILPLIDLNLATYVKFIYIPFIMTAGCILLYEATVTTFELGDWSAIGTAVLLGMLSIALSVSIQFKKLKEGLEFLRHKMTDL